MVARSIIGPRLPVAARYPDPPIDMDPTVLRWAGELIRQLDVRDRAVENGLIGRSVSQTFAIDSITSLDITITEEWGFLPDILNCQVSVSASTADDGWQYALLTIKSVSLTNIVGRIDITNAGTAASVANMNFWVRP